ncbi:MAG TPA: hypothetical protein VF533_18675 [Solirubrobacteraceae bacterium]|jgi:dienelactone hydrolase
MHRCIRVVTLLGASAALVACGGDERRADATPTPTPTPTAAPPAATATPAPPPIPKPVRVRFRATDGVRLKGRLVPGAGRRAPAVVLVHQSDGGPDQWDELVPYLHQAGFAALTYTSRAMPDRMNETHNARDVAGAIRALRRRPDVDGRRVAAVGASIGAAAVAYLGFTPTGKRLPAIVGLSPAPFTDAPPEGRRPHDMLLISDAAERSDAEFIASGERGITLRTAPVDGHGVALLADERVREQVLAWLSRRLRRR